MRLVKLGLAAVNTTVGAFGKNVDRAVGMAREMAAQQVTVAVFPEQLVGGYPQEDLVQWQRFVDRQWTELRALRRRDERLAAGVVRGGDGGPPGAPLQLRGGGGRRQGARTGAQGKAAHLQHLLRGPHLRARRAGHDASCTGACRWATSSSSSTSGVLGAGGLRGRLERRRPDAPPRVLGRRADLQPLGLALPHRGRRHPPRAGVDPRGRSPGAPSPT